MEDAPRQGDESRIVEAMVAAQEKAVGVLESVLGRHASRFSILITVEYDEGGPKNLVFDVEAYRSRVNRRKLEEVIEAAIQAAVEVFEEKTGVRVGKKVRRRGKATFKRFNRDS